MESLGQSISGFFVRRIKRRGQRRSQREDVSGEDVVAKTSSPDPSPKNLIWWRKGRRPLAYGRAPFSLRQVPACQLGMTGKMPALLQTIPHPQPPLQRWERGREGDPPVAPTIAQTYREAGTSLDPGSSPGGFPRTPSGKNS